MKINLAPVMAALGLVAISAFYLPVEEVRWLVILMLIAACVFLYWGIYGDGVKGL